MYLTDRNDRIKEIDVRDNTQWLAGFEISKKKKININFFQTNISESNRLSNEFCNDHGENQ
jgi:hypothetical protein